MEAMAQKKKRWFSQLETSIYGWDFPMAMLNNQMV